MVSNTIHYVNGEWPEAENALVSTSDRAHQFGDGVYEAIAYYNRTPLDLDLHLERLARSLRECRIDNPHSHEKWQTLLQTLIDKNAQEHGNLYVQVTRGAFPRDHRFKAGAKPSVTAHCFAPKTPDKEKIQHGMAVITQPDLRWKRCDIKSLNLLPNVLAKQAATEANAQDALLVKENGEISEASVSNAFAVIGNSLVTHPKCNEILGGITRHITLILANKLNIQVSERPFTLDELLTEANELFLTNTTSNLMPVITVDGKPVGNGKSGEVTLKLLDAYFDHIEEQTGYRIYG